MCMLKERWNTRCQSLLRWIETHNGSLPKIDTTLPCGFAIGKWLRVQRMRLQSQRLEGVRISALDDAAPGWRSMIALSSENLHKRPTATELEREDRFTANLREAAALVAELGRFPRGTGIDTSTDRVANWLVSQRKGNSLGKLSIERVQQLDHTLPGWQNEDFSYELECRWQASLASFVARVKELGRRPTGNDPSAMWMFQQRRALRQGMLSEGRERALNEVVPDWTKPSSRLDRNQRTDCEGTGLVAVSEQTGN